MTLRNVRVWMNSCIDLVPAMRTESQYACVQISLVCTYVMTVTARLSFPWQLMMLCSIWLLLLLLARHWWSPSVVIANCYVSTHTCCFRTVGRRRRWRQRRSRLGFDLLRWAAVGVGHSRSARQWRHIFISLSTCVSRSNGITVMNTIIINKNKDIYSHCETSLKFERVMPSCCCVIRIELWIVSRDLT